VSHRKIRLTSVTAITACSYVTVLVFCAGVALACAGGGGPECGFEKPSVTTEAATSVTAGSAILHGTVNPHGCETSYEFEWGTTEAYGSSTGGSAGSGASNVAKEQFVGGTKGTTYHFRISATNINGTSNGADKTYTILHEKPSVTTGSATSVAEGSATLNGTVNPNGSSTVYSFEYGLSIEYGETSESTGAGSIDVNQNVSHGITGLEPETEYHYRLVATNGKGTTQGSDKTFTTSSSSATWKIKETLNPEGAIDSNLYDLSCEPSTNLCTAVGKSTSSGVDSPLAHRWNGTSWSEQTPAKKSGSTHNRLLGVDCPSESRCIAVGNYQNSEGGPATLAELWNEGKWNVQSTPVPSEATSSELVAVGCNSTANCTAVGSAVIGGVKTAIAARWTSPTWASSSIPIPEGATSSQLDGVDCLWSNFCVAGGRYTTSGGSVKSLAMFWNGAEWSLQTLTDPEEAVQSTLLDVSCTPSPNRCTAVGGWKNSENDQFTLAYRFDGSTWTLQSTPNPSGSIASVFQEVSCATETSCTAAGSWVSSGGGSNKTLAEEWDGSGWSIQGTSNPAGATFSAFFGVSCKESSCLGVGWSTDGSGVDTTLAEIRE
jgi:hypothetical protein